jgi:hypothetical protein
MNQDRLIKLVNSQVKFLDYINCLGCESLKHHNHFFNPEKYKQEAIDILFKRNLISQNELEWLKQCYLNENL